MLTRTAPASAETILQERTTYHAALPHTPPTTPQLSAKGAAHAFALALVPIFLTTVVALTGVALLALLTLVPQRSQTDRPASVLLQRLYPANVSAAPDAVPWGYTPAQQVSLSDAPEEN